MMGHALQIENRHNKQHTVIYVDPITSSGNTYNPDLRDFANMAVFLSNGIKISLSAAKREVKDRVTQLIASATKKTLITIHGCLLVGRKELLSCHYKQPGLFPAPRELVSILEGFSRTI